MTTATHDKAADAVSIYWIATRIEGVPPITAYRRARRGQYGRTFQLDGVWCASVTELKQRGIIKTEQELSLSPPNLAARTLWYSLMGDLLGNKIFDRLQLMTIMIAFEKANQEFKLGVTPADLLPDEPTGQAVVLREPGKVKDRTGGTGTKA